MPSLSFMIQYLSPDDYFTIDFSTSIFLTWSRAVLRTILWDHKDVPQKKVQST